MGKFDGILIASDLDGTLFYEGKISDENAEAIKYFVDNGGLFTTATGRMAPFVQSLGIPCNAPLITSNGTVICDEVTGEIIKLYECPSNALDIVKNVMSNKNIIMINIFTPEGHVTFEDFSENAFDKFDKIINKIVFVFDDRDAALKAKNELNKMYSSDYVFERSWPVGVEMIPVVAGKGNALIEVKKLTGAKVSIGVGDWENDESLIRAADISYAPMSGNPDILAIADHVTVACCDHVIAAIVKDLDEKGTNI